MIAEAKGKRLTAWGRAPEAGRLFVERLAGGQWQPVEDFDVGAKQVFNQRLDIRGKQRMRARIGSATSLVWAHR